MQNIDSKEINLETDDEAGAACKGNTTVIKFPSESYPNSYELKIRPNAEMEMGGCFKKSSNESYELIKLTLSQKYISLYYVPTDLASQFPNCFKLGDGNFYFYLYSISPSNIGYSIKFCVPSQFEYTCPPNKPFYINLSNNHTIFDTPKALGDILAKAKNNQINQMVFPFMFN